VEACLELMTDGCRGRSEACGGKLVDQLQGTVPIQCGVLERSFTVDATSLSDSMAAMCVYDTIAGQVPQPQMKRHRRLLQVGFKPAAGFEKRVLDDITGATLRARARSRRSSTIRRKA
jgi:hypothetical protein